MSEFNGVTTVEYTIPSPEEVDAMLLSKETWHNHVGERVENAQANGTPLSVIFADLDDFKALNDTYGHYVGDVVLHGITYDVLPRSVRMRSDPHDPLRKPDFVGYDKGVSISRFGGDEFAVMAETDENGIHHIASRIRRNFESWLQQPIAINNEPVLHRGKPIVLPESRLISLGISIGTQTLEPGMSASDLLVGADKAMYADKQNHLPALSREQSDFVDTMYEEAIRLGVSLSALTKHLRNRQAAYQALEAE